MYGSSDITLVTTCKQEKNSMCHYQMQIPMINAWKGPSGHFVTTLKNQITIPAGYKDPITGPLKQCNNSSWKRTKAVVAGVQDAV